MSCVASTSRVLVVGGTGLLGAPVVRHLAANGYAVRVLARDPARARALFNAGVDIVAGDVTVLATIRAAMQGCAHVYVSLRGTNTVASYESVEIGGVENLAACARESGIERVAYLSGAGETRGNERYFPVSVKLRCERTLERSGLPYTIFRATHFMESLPMFVRDGRATVLGRQPHRYHYLAVQDYARIVATALVHPQAANRTFVLFGPQAWTMRQALERYVAAAMPGTSVSALPLPLARAMAFLTRNPDLAFAAELFTAFAAIGEAGDPTPADALFGRAATTLDEWIRRHARAG